MLDVAEQVETILPFGLSGTVTRIVGLTAAAAGFPAPLGAICRIHREQGTPVDGAVVGFQGEETLLLAYGDLGGVRRGNRVTLLQSVPQAHVGERLWGECSMAAGDLSTSFRRLPGRIVCLFTDSQPPPWEGRESTRRSARASA